MENTHDVVQKAGEWDVLVVLSLRVLFRQEKRAALETARFPCLGYGDKTRTFKISYRGEEIVVRIITSLLDADFYKFTMGQFVFHRYQKNPVTYALVNRTKGVRLADVVSAGDLRMELDAARALRFGNSDLHYLRGTNEYGERMFKEDWLGFLKSFRLPEYNLETCDGQFLLSFSGTWAEAIFWETIALSIINELYYSSLVRRLSSFEKDKIRAEGILRLGRKIRMMREYPDITFCDFGTRRRFSREWQDYVVGTLAQELPPSQFLGTSNTHIAMQKGLLPMGTSAHELFMGMAGIMCGSDEEIRASHNRVLRDWWDEYGWGLSVALTDTFGSDFFFRDMTQEQARLWKGLRWDSGDPIAFGEKAIRFYQSHGIDPGEKMIVFSDGLTAERILQIAGHFRGRIRVTFGWGTNLTNDLGLQPLSLVVKLVESNGHRVVKLSDNIAKATGDPEVVERFKRIFQYDNAFHEACVY